MHHVDPSPENFAKFKAMDRDAPIHLLNMIRYRDQAAYAPGSEWAVRGWTGEQAFAEYFRLLLPRVAALGGGLVWNGTFECVMTGPAEPEWDKVFVMGLPSAGAFFALVTDPGYKAEVVIHRSAGVLDSRLIRYGV